MVKQQAVQSGSPYIECYAQHMLFENIPSNQSWFHLAVFTALDEYEFVSKDKSQSIFYLNIILSIIWLKPDADMSLNFGPPHIYWPLLHNIGNKQANTHIYPKDTCI